MEQFYFQLISGIFGTLITGFVGFMCLNTWKMANKITAFDERWKATMEDINSISGDVRELRKYDAMIASHAVTLSGIDRRITDLEHYRKRVK